MDAIPQCVPMSNREDVSEYLRIFEDTQRARKNPEQNWFYTLIPLLSKSCKAAILDMPADLKNDYKHLKAEVLATSSKSNKHASKTFWEFEKPPGSTWREIANSLLKKIRKFTPGPNVDDVRNQVAMEKLVQLLPFRAQAFVREREPKTLLEAADLASSYFYSHNMDEQKYDSEYYKKNQAQNRASSPKHFPKNKQQSQH